MKKSGSTSFKKSSCNSCGNVLYYIYNCKTSIELHYDTVYYYTTLPPICQGLFLNYPL